MPSDPQTTAGSVKLELRSEHPSLDLHDALTPELWETLASMAVEQGLVAVPAAGLVPCLEELGVLYRSGRPTAAGYALLLGWHRRFSLRRRTLRLSWLQCLTIHEMRMRDLWRMTCG